MGTSTNTRLISKLSDYSKVNADRLVFAPLPGPFWGDPGPGPYDADRQDKRSAHAVGLCTKNMSHTGADTEASFVASLFPLY